MPVEVRVKIPPELREISQRLRDVDTTLARGTALKSFAPILDRALKTNSQPPNGGGGFARGWMVSLLPSAKGLNIVNAFGKAKFVEYDTKPHSIWPKRRKVLAWRKGGKAPFSAYKVKASTKKGAFIFAANIWHPGTKGKGVFAKTIRQTAPQLFDMLKAELRKLFD